MRKQFTYGAEYSYKGQYIYKITRCDYCVYGEDGMVIIDELTLKAAKAKIDEMLNK